MKNKIISLGDDMYMETELGGINDSLRYYIVLSSENLIKSDYKNLIQISFSLVNRKYKSSIEQVKFNKNYLVFKMLIPIDFSVDQVVMNLIKIVNSEKAILRNHYLCTNTSKPKENEIKEYLVELKNV